MKNALAGLPVVEKRDVIALTLVLDYSKTAAVRQMVEAFHAEIVDEKYGADVSFKIELPKISEGRFIREITDLTRGEPLVTR